MADKSRIEWTDASWNPVTGCSKVSQGCKHCYAERDWTRLQHLPAFAGRRFTDVAVHPDRLDQPLRWARPRRIFVNSMSDLFHESVPEDFIDSVWAVMALAPQHVYQILTKRPTRMRDYLNAPDRYQRVLRAAERLRRMRPKLGNIGISHPAATAFWPHVWLGVSIEDQATADERIPPLLATPAAVRWLSMEPLLGPVDIDHAMYGQSGVRRGISCFGFTDGFGYEVGLHWVVVGGESGPQARPIHPDWVRSLRDQCQAANVPFYFKQWGEWLPGHQYEAEHVRQDPDPEQSRFRCLDWNGERFIEVDGSGKDDIGHDAVYRVGKRLAGRVLDGRTWEEYPAQGVSRESETR